MQIQQNRDQLKLIEVAISSYIETQVINKLPTESEIEYLSNLAISMLYPKLSSNEKKEIKKMLNERFQFKLDMGTMIVDTKCEPWFKEFKSNSNNLYFERYKEYLKKEKGFNNYAVNTLDNEILDEIMDYLGDPRQQYFSPRRGLVMGDVQSGKTSTYTGLICKAADAGYKAIIVLTGTVESLRQQTQRRLDEGFVGFDSDHMDNKELDDHWIGVGKYNKKRGIVLTSTSSDFVSSTAKNSGFSLTSFNDTVLFVIKKNVSVLKKLIRWLGDLNGSANDGKIDFPLLVIDDEADNASINTNKEEDENPTKINGHIRELLSKFIRNNYVGFTATPFANVFINPDISEGLFPKDFVYSLKSPQEYIGPSSIFSNHAEYRDQVKTNNDCEEIVPMKHKNYHPFDRIPSTLETAIHGYMIINVIRDLRKQHNTHRTMMINISRYIETQKMIKDVIENYVSEVVKQYRLYGNEYQEIFSKEISITKKVFESEFPSVGLVWQDILNNLYESNKNVECLDINTSSPMIDYDDYKSGARLIIIGGLSLSRGLTLEGLCISYLYRSSQVYDVLLQMGRWFGYRKGYNDLFRIWLPNHLIDWYETISDSIEELKLDLERMKDLKQKPIEFGIRIRSDKAALKITANNKMRTAYEIQETISLLGSWEDTGSIAKDINTNKYNYNVIHDNLIKLNNMDYLPTREFDDKLVWKNIPKNYIIEILNNFKVDSLNETFDKNGLVDFIQSYEQTDLDLFDIAIVEGDKNNSAIHNFLGHSLALTEKQFDIRDTSIRINKSKKNLVNPIDTSYGLSDDQKKIAEEIHKRMVLSENPTKDPKKIYPSAKAYLRIKDRNPLLIIYFIDLKFIENEEDYEIKKAIKDNFNKEKVIPVGIAIAIPRYTEEYKSNRLYKINITEQRNILNREDEYYD